MELEEKEFKYLELLLGLQDKEGLHLGTKLSKAHIYYDKQKMKVRLATQLFSNSVAYALNFCRNELSFKEFEGCEGTVIFINIINNIFDILNSHSIRPPGLKKARIKPILDLSEPFLKALSII